MSYVLTHTNGKIFKTLGDGVVDTSTGLSLIGQNFHNYGQLMANNFIRLLENQANTIQPANPLAGQLWWDTKNKILKYFDGARFKPCSSSAVGENAPHVPMIGDQWWDTTFDQLKIFNGETWVVVGPNYLKGRGPTGAELVNVIDSSSWSREVGLLQVNGNPIAFLHNNDPFILSEPVHGVNVIGTGLTLVGNNIINGTTTNAITLDGVPVEQFAKRAEDNTFSNASIFTGTVAVINNSGLTIGNNGTVNIKSGTNGKLYFTSANSIVVSAGTTSLIVDQDLGQVVLSTDPTVEMGATTKRYVDVEIDKAEVTLTNYVNLKANSIIANSAISTLNGLSNAINNDPNYYINNQSALALKAPLNSPQLSGIPVSPTPNVGDNSGKIATTAFVQRAITNGNVTMVGTLANVTVTGDVVGRRFIGDGSELINIPTTALTSSTVKIGNTTIPLGSSVSSLDNLSTITASSISGNFIGNIAGTVLSPSQPNITEVGTLSNLTVRDSTVVKHIDITGNTLISGNKTSINSPIVEIANKTIILSKASNTASASDGSGIVVHGPTNKPSILYESSDDSWVINKKLTAPTFFGQGVGLTNIPNSALVNTGRSIIGNTVISPGSSTITLTGLNNVISNTFTGNLDGVAQFAIEADVVINPNQPAITSVGTLSSLNVDGNAIINNLTISGEFTVNGTSTSFVDNNIVLAKNAIAAQDANGAGITVGGPANASILYNSATDSWEFNKTVKAEFFAGTAMRANYADVAEMYASDAIYEPGTVVMIRENGVTIASGEKTTKVVGVVSEEPAYLLNAAATMPAVPVALIGKVKCKVIGKVAAGDRLAVSDVDGVAMSIDTKQTFGDDQSVLGGGGFGSLPSMNTFNLSDITNNTLATPALAGSINNIINNVYGFMNIFSESQSNKVEPGSIIGKSLVSDATRGTKLIDIIIS